MRESRLSGSVEGAMSDHDSYSDIRMLPAAHYGQKTGPAQRLSTDPGLGFEIPAKIRVIRRNGRKPENAPLEAVAVGT